MHEVTVARGIIDELEGRLADGRLEGRVRTVRLRVGRLTCIARGALQTAFAVLSRSTSLARATLEVEEVPIRAVCRPCGTRFQVVELDFACPRCSSREVEVAAGRELVIDSVEVE